MLSLLLFLSHLSWPACCQCCSTRCSPLQYALSLSLFVYLLPCWRDSLLAPFLYFAVCSFSLVLICCAVCDFSLQLYRADSSRGFADHCWGLMACCWFSRDISDGVVAPLAHVGQQRVALQQHGVRLCTSANSGSPCSSTVSDCARRPTADRPAAARRQIVHVG